MKRTEQLANRAREVLTEGKWVIGSNFKEQILDLDWQEAIQKINSLNSIADLTYHVSYYIAGMSNVMEGGSLDIRDKFSFDYPSIKSGEDWKNLVDKFCADSERFIRLIEDLPEERLEDIFVDEKYGNYSRNVDAIIEHSYYHFGQVVIIKKMIRNSS